MSACDAMIVAHALSATSAYVAPPAGTFAAILGRLESAPPAIAAGGNVVALRRSLVRWRITSAIVGAAAAVLAGVVVLERTGPAPQTEFVAILTAEGAKPAFVASVDTVKGTISVRRVVDAARATELGRGVAAHGELERILDLGLEGVGQFESVAGEELDAVVGIAVVRGADHHASAEPQRAR